MDPGRWRQIEHLYHAALEKEAIERASFLDESCAADPSLRQEVESLLAIADDADGYLKAAVLDSTLESSTVSAGVRPARDPLPTTRKLGRYELLDEIGKGGMGVVYRAADPAIGRTVAIKTILLGDSAEEKSSELRTRLLRESQAGGQLSHPNIVAVYDVSEEGTTAYIVMEYVVGQTLGQATARDGSLHSISEVLRIVQECASALDYAHSRGVVHRDIKPANIMLQADGAVKIADFGIAKAAQLTPLTQSATVVGSPLYMAPEQWKGEPVTGRTDQYALAAVAYELLTGRRPFETDTMASLAAQTLYEEPPAVTSSNPTLPGALDSVFRKALSKTAAARYETCSQLAGALRSACERGPASSSQARRRSKRLAAVIAASVLAAVAGSGWLYQRNLKRYPKGQFADLAQARLTALKNQRPPEANPVTPAKETKAAAKVSPSRTPDRPQRDSAYIPKPTVAQSDPPAAGDPYVRGDILLKAGAYAEAVPYFSQAIAIKPEYHSYFGRAGAYQRLERLDQAIEDYSQAIGFNPASAMAYHERAVCLARLKQDDRALADYNRALELAPGYPLSWNGRGVIYLHRKEYEKAISDFSEAIRLRPTLDQPYKNRAAARKGVGDTAGAIADLNQALALKR